MEKSVRRPENRQSVWLQLEGRVKHERPLKERQEAKKGH